MPTVSELSQRPEFSGDGELINTESAMEDLRFHRILKVHSFWQELSKNGLPSRQQIDPVALGPQILPYLVLIDVLKSGQDFRWRLFGSRHVEEYGTSLSGISLSEVMDGNPQFKVVKDILDATVKKAAPQFFKMDYSSRNEVVRTAIGVMLPLWDGGEKPAVLLGAADWIDAPIGY